MLVRWSHQTTYTLLGVGNRITLRVPLSCMQVADSLVIQKAEYDVSFRELEIVCDIIRRPHLSQYVGQDIEFFHENFVALNPPQGTPLTPLR